MDIKTTSFPHLGLYGDVLVLHKRNDERVVFEVHSALKKQQQEYERKQAESAKKIQEKLQKPDVEKGEEIYQFADDVSPYQMKRHKETVPIDKVLQPDIEKGEQIITITDDIPFLFLQKKREEKKEND
jgi:hypothetical protein